MLTFKIEKDGNQYHAYCQELKGCHTFGDTPQNALKNLKEAIDLYIVPIHSKDLPTGTTKAILKDAGLQIPH